VEDVRNMIRSEKPDAVMVELDRKRYNRLVAASPEQQFLEEMMRLFVGAGMGPVGRLIGVGLMGFYRMLAYRGLQPGREFKVRRQSEVSKSSKRRPLFVQSVESLSLASLNLTFCACCTLCVSSA
jgi:hypothetical protein